MKYYFAIMKNEIMKFASKQIKIETIILSDIAQTQKNKHHLFSLICDTSLESLDMCISSGIPINVRKLLRTHGMSK